MFINYFIVNVSQIFFFECNPVCPVLTISYILYHYFYIHVIFDNSKLLIAKYLHIFEIVSLFSINKFVTTFIHLFVVFKTCSRKIKIQSTINCFQCS